VLSGPAIFVIVFFPLLKNVEVGKVVTLRNQELLASRFSFLQFVFGFEEYARY
jgi:hypothetical protein